MHLFSSHLVTKWLSICENTSINVLLALPLSERCKLVPSNTCYFKAMKVVSGLISSINASTISKQSFHSIGKYTFGITFYRLLWPWKYAHFTTFVSACLNQACLLWNKDLIRWHVCLSEHLHRQHPVGISFLIPTEITFKLCDLTMYEYITWQWHSCDLESVTVYSAHCMYSVSATNGQSSKQFNTSLNTLFMQVQNSISFNSKIATWKVKTKNECFFFSETFSQDNINQCQVSAWIPSS